MRRDYLNRVTVRTHRLPEQQKKTSSLFMLLVLASILIICLFRPVAAKTVLPEQNSVLNRTLFEEALNTNKNTQHTAFNQAMNAYENSDYHLALRLLIPLAQNHHAEAQFFTGMIFDAGLGVKRDPVKAFSWYRLAADKGYHHAQHNLAVAYAKGDGTRQNLARAVVWWKHAARQGNTDSQYNLGIIYATGNNHVQRDLLKAEKWWRKAAINGDAMAQYNLGALYANGENKVTSYCEAIRWWQESARAGINQAQEAIKLLKQRPDFHPC